MQTTAADDPELTGLQQLWLVAALAAAPRPGQTFTRDDPVRRTAADPVEVEAAAVWMEVWGLAVPVANPAGHWTLSAAGLARAQQLAAG